MNKEITKSNSTKIFRLFFISLAALLLNIITALLALKLNLIIFLDTVFTVALTFYAGLIPGLLAALFYNPIMTEILCLIHGKSFFIYDGLYCICGMLIVLITWAFNRKRIFEESRTITIFYLIIISFATAIASCLCASLLDTFVRPLFGPASGFGPTDTFSYSFTSLNFGDFLAYLLPRIPLTFLDRLISTFAAYSIYKLMYKFTAKKELSARLES